MTRSQWRAIALELAKLRRRMADKWRLDPANDSLQSLHDKKLIRHAQLAAVDAVARVLAKCLKAQSSRFIEERFLESIGVDHE